MAESDRCQQLAEQLARYRDQALPAAEQQALAEHQTGCAACQELLVADDALDSLLSAAGSPSLSLDAAARVDARVLALGEPGAVPAPTPLPWAWLVGLLLALLAVAVADPGHPAPASRVSPAVVDPRAGLRTPQPLPRHTLAPVEAPRLHRP